MYRIVIGDKAYSSWSLRGWLLLAAFGLEFREVPVRLDDPAFERMKQQRTPARTVPILEWDEDGRTRRIWDTVAIAETLADRHPEAGIWPADPWHRAVARALAAEMHAGFATLRDTCPMDLHRTGQPPRSRPPALDADLARLAELWRWALDETGGPWLGGPAFSAADAFFAPVAFRLTGYDLMAPPLEGYARRLLDHPAIQHWRTAAEADPRRLRCDTDL